MERVSKLVLENQMNSAWYEAVIGVEKESLRVLKDGRMALTDHPVSLGKRSIHPYIQTDFSESQVELITPPFDTIEEMEDWLSALHDVTLRSMEKGEYLWPFSIPAVVPKEEQIPIAKLENEADVRYREFLADTYGKKKQLISGIHVNFEINRTVVDSLYSKELPAEDYKDFKNQLYVKLAKNYLRYRWLITYLFGASPVAGENFYSKDQIPLEHPVRSIRSSHYGYVNAEDVTVSFDSLEEYATDILKMVEEGHLSEEREFYSSVRFRGTNSVTDLLEKGISYIELRNLDLNPYDEFGLSLETVRFIHLFCLYLIWMEESASHSEIDLGQKMADDTALEIPDSPSQYLEEGMTLLTGMKEMLQQTNGSKEDLAIIARAEELFAHPEKTLAARIVQDIKKNGSYIAFGMDLAQKYKDNALKAPYATRGFTDMEMSTQLLLFDALQKGIKVELLDRKEQFLKLTYDGKEEIVKNGNMTSRDTYISPLIMENKTVTKNLLSEKGYIVPAGEEYTTSSAAKKAFWRYENKPIVVKPKSTNYGIGISIFKNGPTEEDYANSIDFAFKEDNAVLVEEFIEGTEYRLFVINKEVPAVLLRVPANVVGNGKDTIETLVAEKNKDPLRGEEHRTPLAKIQLGDIEQLMLKEQGYTITSIPEVGETVYLRENSNISTGGDSIDMTDEMDESYKKIAVEVTEIMGAEVSGVDLIVPDLKQPTTLDHPGYTVIEANFNPAMNMHAYVTEGKGRRLTQNVLKMLYPSLTW